MKYNIGFDANKVVPTSDSMNLIQQGVDELVQDATQGKSKQQEDDAVTIDLSGKEKGELTTDEQLELMSEVVAELIKKVEALEGGSDN